MRLGSGTTYAGLIARPLRVEFSGAVYHVTARGNDRQRIYLEADDHRRFLAVLTEVVARYGFVCHSYCLMGNHYHLLVETPRPNLAVGMRQLNGLYSRRFNRVHGRLGHLFQARYRAILVEKERHLLALSRYIVLNPVRARLRERPADWPWSSYRATIGEEERPALLATDWLLAQFGGDPGKATAAYREFVEGCSRADPWQELRGGIYLGSEQFVASHAPREDLSNEISFEQRVPLRPPLSELLTEQGPEGILSAHRHGYRLHEIARILGVHTSTVSRRLRALERGVLECKT